MVKVLDEDSDLGSVPVCHRLPCDLALKPRACQSFPLCLSSPPVKWRWYLISPVIYLDCDLFKVGPFSLHYHQLRPCNAAITEILEMPCQLHTPLCVLHFGRSAESSFSLLILYYVVPSLPDFPAVMAWSSLEREADFVWFRRSLGSQMSRASVI